MYLSSLYYPNIIGGAEIIVQTLAESIISKGYEAVVVCTSPDSGINVQIINGVKVYYIGLKNIYWPHGENQKGAMLRTIWHLFDIYNPLMGTIVGNIIDSEHPDVIHSNTLTGISVAAWRQAKIRNVPILHTLHDYYLLCPKSAMFKNGRNCIKMCTVCRFYSTIKHYFSNYVDVVVGVSSFVLERHKQQGYFTNTIKQCVVKNGITAPEKVSVHNKIKNQRRLNIGYIGRLTSSKGIEQLLQSLKTLDDVDWKLWVAGSGKAVYVDYLRKINPDADITFMGYVKPEELFSEIDVLIVPSLWHEPFGLIVLDAFSYGVPVIGANRGGITELIDEASIGYVYEPLEPESLKNILRDIYADFNIVNEMRTKLLAKPLNYTAERMVNEYIDLYMEMNHV